MFAKSLAYLLFFSVQVESDAAVNENSPHIVNIGRMVEVSRFCCSIQGVFPTSPPMYKHVAKYCYPRLIMF